MENKSIKLLETNRLRVQLGTKIPDGKDRFKELKEENYDIVRRIYVKAHEGIKDTRVGAYDWFPTDLMNQIYKYYE